MIDGVHSCWNWLFILKRVPMKEQDVYADSLEEGMLDKLREKEARSQRPRTREKKQYDEMEISAHGLKIQFAGFLEKLGQSDTREQVAMG